MAIMLVLDPPTVYSSDSHSMITYPFMKEADSVMNMTQGLDSLYVYTDDVESRIVGDSLVSLLRIVPIQGAHGRTISKHFNNAQYLPLLRKDFGTIEIVIRDDTGHALPFERGKVTVTLLFRRRRTGLFKKVSITTIIASNRREML